MRKTGHESVAIHGFELIEAAAIHQTSNNLPNIIRFSLIRRNDTRNFCSTKVIKYTQSRDTILTKTAAERRRRVGVQRGGSRLKRHTSWIKQRWLNIKLLEICRLLSVEVPNNVAGDAEGMVIVLSEVICDTRVAAVHRRSA